MLYPFTKTRFRKRLTAGCFILALAIFLFAPLAVSRAAGEGGVAAANPAIQGNLQTVVTQAQYLNQEKDIRVIVGKIVKAALTLLGAVAVIIVMYGGYLYMTSGGDSTKLQKARQVLVDAFIGLAIILAAYTIVSYIFQALTGQPRGGVSIAAEGPGYKLSGGAFGSVIQSHYPTPEQKGVPRNAMILVTFRMPIDPTSVIGADDANYPCPTTPAISGCGALNRDVFKVYKCSDIEGFSGLNPADCLKQQIADPQTTTATVPVPGYAFVTEDNRTIVFNPYGDTDEYLGSPTEDVGYIVHLRSGIMREGGASSVFSTAYPDYYWRFTTSTLLDFTPPQIESIIPAVIDYDANTESKNGLYDNTGKVYRNQILVVNFNEPVIPPLRQTQYCNNTDNSNEVQVAVQTPIKRIKCNTNGVEKCLESTGVTCTESTAGCELNGSLCDTSGVACVSCATTHIPGAWQVGLNGYRTVQFTTTLPCENVSKNSCGEQAYCLPDHALIDELALAAVTNGPVAIPGTGIMDVAGNSLDGNRDTKADGQDSAYNSLNEISVLVPTSSVRFPLLDKWRQLNDAGDDYTQLKDSFFWRILTGNEVDLVPPHIISLSPNNGQGNNAVDVPINIYASEGLDAYSADREVKIFGKNADDVAFDGWYDPNMGQELVSGVYHTNMSKITMTHGPFEQFVVGTAPSLYTPVIKSRLRDLRQNCFNPSGEKDDTGTPSLPSVASSNCDTSIGEFPDYSGYSCCPSGGGAQLTGIKQGLCNVPKETMPACNDTVDNDDDGKTDYPVDPACDSIYDDDEWPKN